MPTPSASPYLYDMLEAIERVRQVLGDMSLDLFENDWQKQWLVERGIEIISEASRRLPDELKVRHPEIPRPKVAGIGNILLHSYQHVSAPILWKLEKEDLSNLEQVCREGLARI